MTLKPPEFMGQIQTGNIFWGWGMDVVKFVRMKDGDMEDYVFLREQEIHFAQETADRVINMLMAMENSMAGYKVSRLTHSAQAATRAWRDGADIDWVVTALLHDIGDELAPFNHSDLAASILKPFVRKQCYWTVRMHGLFQMVYYADMLGEDPDGHAQYADHPFYDDCVEFCERWDQSSFDPVYDTLPAAFFFPMVQEIFRRPAFDPAITETDLRVPLTDPDISAGRTGH